MHQKTLLLYITKNTFILYYGACNDTFSLLGKHVLTFPNLLSKVRRYMLKDSEFRVMLWKLLAKKIQPLLYFMSHVAVAAVLRIRCHESGAFRAWQLDNRQHVCCQLYDVRCVRYLSKVDKWSKYNASCFDALHFPWGKRESIKGYSL